MEPRPTDRSRTLARTLPAALALLVCCGSTMAQVLTPMPEKAPTPPEKELRDPPPMVVTPPQPEPRAAAPAPQPRRAVVQAPDVEYQSLVKRDGDGQLIPLDRPANIAALYVNPILSKDSLALVETFLVGRRDTFERLILENLDAIESVADPALQTRKDLTREMMTPIVNKTRVLIDPPAPGALASDLRNAGLFTPEQAALHNKIVREYRQATTTKTPPNATDDEKRLHSVRELFKLYRAGLEEPIMIYEDLLAEAASSFGRTLPGAGLTSETMQMATSKAANLKTDSPRAAKIEAARAVMADLSPEQRKAVLAATIALRAEKK